MRLAVITDDNYLWQKIYLLLRERAGVFRIADLAEGEYDLCLYHGDLLQDDIRVIRMGRESGCQLKIPFSPEELYRAVGEIGHSRSIRIGERCAFLGDEKIPLTDVELKLLVALVDAKGEYVSRAELLHRVWGDNADGGVINVYIHYLREKLEKGEKIILSSRKMGYCIDRRFLDVSQ